MDGNRGESFGCEEEGTQSKVFVYVNGDLKEEEERERKRMRDEKG